MTFDEAIDLVAKMPPSQAAQVRKHALIPLQDALLLHSAKIIGKPELIAIAMATNEVLRRLPMGVGVPQSIALQLDSSAAAIARLLQEAATEDGE